MKLLKKELLTGLKARLSKKTNRQDSSDKVTIKKAITKVGKERFESIPPASSTLITLMLESLLRSPRLA